MALHLPSVKPKQSNEGAFRFHEDGSGLGNVVAHPLAAKSQITTRHPLEHVLNSSMDHQLALQRSVLLHAQGPAGPMINAMELRAASSVGRLPFLESSNFQRDVLTGKDEEIDFDDIFGIVSRSSEAMVHPHVVMDTFKHHFGSF